MCSRRGAKGAVEVATKEMSAAQSPGPQFSADTQRLTTAQHGGHVDLLEKTCYRDVRDAPGAFAKGITRGRLYTGRSNTRCMAGKTAVWTALFREHGVGLMRVGRP